MNVPGLYSQLILLVIVPLIAGMLFSRKHWSGAVSSRLFSIVLYVFHASIAMLAVWQAQLSNRSWILPFIALTGWCVSMGIAAAGSSWMKHGRQRKGAFLFSIGLSNHGYTLLGIIALMVFGEQGLAQATYAQFFITPFIILICFPTARFYGGAFTSISSRTFLRQNIFDTRNIPLAAMLVGITLNLTGVERPAFFSRIVPGLVYIGTVLSGFAVGLLFNAARFLKYHRENLFSLIYRSTLYPLFFFAAARIFGLDSLDTRILLLFGIVPSAIFSNLIADLFNLDSNLTNSVFVIGTTFFLVLVLPIYLYAVYP